MSVRFSDFVITMINSGGFDRCDVDLNWWNKTAQVQYSSGLRQADQFYVVIRHRWFMDPWVTLYRRDPERGVLRVVDINEGERLALFNAWKLAVDRKLAVEQIKGIEEDPNQWW